MYEAEGEGEGEGEGEDLTEEELEHEILYSSQELKNYILELKGNFTDHRDDFKLNDE